MKKTLQVLWSMVSAASLSMFIGLVIAQKSNAATGEFDTTSIPEVQVECLALNLYHEARNQNNTGMLAVAFVTLNRVESSRYPDTYCGVITDGYDPFRYDCQFSWYCDGKSDLPKEIEAWEYARAFAKFFAYQHEYIVDPTSGSTHYHANYVNPWWAELLAYHATIGDHLFYSEYL